jgi:organic hydroperoxide reductase OsmC/OhrA
VTTRPSVSVRWRGGALAFASAHGDVMRVTPAATLTEGAGCWSPEELLAGAAAASFAVRLVEEAERSNVPLVDATLQAECCVLGGEVDCVRIDAVLETLHGYEDDVRDLASTAANCLVWEALLVPVDLNVHVNAAEAEATRRALAALS